MGKSSNEVSKNSKWWISKHRYLELCHHCLQYKEWKDEYNTLDGKKAINYDGMPRSETVGDPTFEIAQRRAELIGKIQTIEMTAHETDVALAKYILKAVTEENITYEYLKNIMKIPMGRRQFYEKRRKFFWLLDGHMKNDRDKDFWNEILKGVTH